MKFTGVLFFSVSFLFVFLSCDAKYYSVTVRNNSSETVEYTFNGSTARLISGNSKEYQIEAYTPGPKDISIISVPNEEVMKIKMETMLSGEEYIFTNAKKLDLEVENTLNYEITLMADNYIDDNSGKTRLLVPAQSNTTTGTIYTDTPKFTIAPPSGYYPTIEWNITDNTMHVTIK